MSANVYRALGGLIVAVLLLGLSQAPAVAASKAGSADWKNEWNKTLAAAKQEGKVVVYGPPGADVRKVLTEEFQKAYGIPVDFWGIAGGGQLAARVQSERQAGRYTNDLFIFGATTLWGPLKPALMPLRDNLILPEVKDPKNWKEFEFSDSEGKFVLSMQLDIGNEEVINTSLVKPEELKSYTNLLEPRWKGKIVVADPRSVGQGDYSLTSIYGLMGKEFLVKLLKEQQPTVSASAEQIATWIAQGRFPIGISAGHTLVQKYIEQGLPILGWSPMEGGYMSPGYYSLAMVDKAPHPNAAKIYANWLLGKDAQHKLSVLSGQASARADVPRDHLNKLAVAKAGQRFWRPHFEKNEPASESVKALFDEIFGK